MASSQPQRTLPVRRFKERVVDKIKLNRVTLIYADTGSGKSTQVPQMLLEEGLAPILCTQPRRLATVAVSKLVAKECGCLLGEEVGYHIGQKKVASTRSKIVFETAGVFLEELRCEGLKVLSKYKVVILDEVHERSIESDLVLACMKQFMQRKNTIRLVLMSATADSLRYKDYFKEIDRGEKVEIFSIANFAAQLGNAMFNCKVSYLEQVVDLLGNELQHAALLNSMHGDPLPYEKGTDMGEGTRKLITDLVVHIHKSDSETNGSVLVFLPTYKALEQQWSLLKGTGLPLKLHVLHSSIDMEHSMRAMEVSHLSQRKVILATNVAESSVTMPGVSYVIDSCRSLEIYWDNDRKTHLPRLVWVSQSQADQRKGRTGRTCDGKVFRVVPRAVFNGFQQFEMPAMQLLSLRKQVLMIVCAESKAINDPTVLFQRSLDPPATQTVPNALEVLQNIGSIITPFELKGKYIPTMYGKLLASLPLSLEASLLVIKGGQVGLLKEASVLATLMDGCPFPILRPFGQQTRYEMHLERYYQGPGSSFSDSDVAAWSYASILMANLNAFEFWQSAFKDKKRLEKLLAVSESRKLALFGSSIELERLELEWCTQHHLSRSALHAIEETSSTIIEALHRFRPKFLFLSSGPPSYYRAYEFDHICTLFQEENIVRYFAEDNDLDCEPESMICCEGYFVASGTFHSSEEEKQLTALVDQVRKSTLQSSPLEEQNEEDNGCSSKDTVPLCSFFQRGSCTKGTDCLFAHSVSAKPLLCKFYMTPSGCRYGDACRFLHGEEDSVSLNDTGVVEFEDELPSAGLFLKLLPSCEGEKHAIEKFYETECAHDEPWDEGSNVADEDLVLLFGDVDFEFAERLLRHYEPTKVVATTSVSREDALLQSKSHLESRITLLSKAGMELLWGIDVNSLLSSSSGVPWSKLGFISWIVKGSSDDDVSGDQKQHVRDFFAAISSTLLSEALEHVQILLTIYSSQFSYWQVERAARDCFFFLSQSLPFNTVTFGCYTSPKSVELLCPRPKPVTYVFELQPPSEFSNRNC